jgi:hypothetical protein
MVRVALRRLFLPLVLVLPLASCAPRAGYGVLLWAPGKPGEAEPVSVGGNGSIVPLVRESKIQKTFWVRPRGRHGLAEIPVWRFRAFPDKKQAQRYAGVYAPLANVYAFPLRRGLPVREAPRPDAKIVYKLGTEQVVKVTARGERPTRTGVYTNTWYRLVTDDGFEGYCFGQYLKIFQTTEDPYQTASQLRSRDESLARIFSEEWRPEYFREMLDKKRVDLRRFREDIGFFANVQTKKVRIQKAASAYEFNYREVRKLTGTSYQFEGTDLRVEFLDGGERLLASYNTGDRAVSEVYLLIEEDLSEIINRERARKQEVYKPFAGTTLRSSGYGIIEFGPEMTFAWDGYERLVPAVVPAGAGSRGRIEIRYYLDAEAARRFDGVLTFRFAALNDREVNFFYKREGTALRLVYATPRATDDLLMRAAAASTWVLFFE